MGITGNTTVGGTLGVTGVSTLGTTSISTGGTLAVVDGATINHIFTCDNSTTGTGSWQLPQASAITSPFDIIDVTTATDSIINLGDNTTSAGGSVLNMTATTGTNNTINFVQDTVANNFTINNTSAGTLEIRNVTNDVGIDVASTGNVTMNLLNVINSANASESILNIGDNSGTTAGSILNMTTPVGETNTINFIQDTVANNCIITHETSGNLTLLNQGTGLGLTVNTTGSVLVGNDFTVGGGNITFGNSLTDTITSIGIRNGGDKNVMLWFDSSNSEEFKFLHQLNTFNILTSSGNNGLTVTSTGLVSFNVGVDIGATGSFKLASGTPAVGSILTSNAGGTGTWQPLDLTVPTGSSVTNLISDATPNITYTNSPLAGKMNVDNTISAATTITVSGTGGTSSDDIYMISVSSGQTPNISLNGTVGSGVFQLNVDNALTASCVIYWSCTRTSGNVAVVPA